MGFDLNLGTIQCDGKKYAKILQFLCYKIAILLHVSE